LEEDGIDFCFGVGACGRGCNLALFVSDVVGNGDWPFEQKRTARNGCATCVWSWS
jgi:hypothetical protein